MNVKELVKAAAVAVHKPLRPLLQRFGVDTKRLYEITYWRLRSRDEGQLKNDWYESIFTSWFGIPREFYTGLRLLDIGCGPRGSLEWADMAAERIGLDPLVDDYRSLGIDRHAMSYAHAPAERIPFGDNYFDVVSSINSLDHVDNVDAVIGEIARVLKPRGTLLLVVEIHPEPTIAEPHALTWSFLERFQPALRLLDEHHFEVAEGQHALEARVPFDHADPRSRNGWLQARLIKESAPVAA